MTTTTPRYARPLVGRDALLQQVVDALQVRRRVVSLVGPGGVGKTRLAAAAVAKVRCVWVPLGAVPTADEVPEAVAVAMGLGAEEDPEAAVAAAIGEQVVVLDEVEHLAALRPLLERWLEACPRATWLVTTRRALRMVSEHAVEVDTLPLPAPDALVGSPAARLLQDAAPQPIDLEAQGEAVAAILRLTGGLPLAIELAAARLALLPLEALRARIDQRYFATLHDPMRPERGLQVVLDDSWSALSEVAQCSLAESSVFAAPFEVGQAERVLSGADRALDALQELRALQLVQVRDGRVSLLEPVRRFAADRLGDATAATFERHGRWVVDLAMGALQRFTAEPRAVDEIAGLAPELRAALARAEDAAVAPAIGIVCAEALCRLQTLRGSAPSAVAVAERGLNLDPADDPAARKAHVSLLTSYVQRLAADRRADAVDVAMRALRDDLEPDDRASLLLQLGAALLLAGQLGEARDALERAIDLGPEHRAWTWARVELALVLHDLGEAEAADRHVEEVHEAIRAAGDPGAEARLAEIATCIAIDHRDVPTGHRWNALMRRHSEHFGDRRKVGLSVLYDAVLYEIAGDLDQARAHYADAKERLLEVEASPLVANANGGLCRIAMVDGRLDDAAALMQAWRPSWRPDHTEGFTFLAALAALQGDLDELEAAAALGATGPLFEIARRVIGLLEAPLDDVRRGPAALLALEARLDEVDDPIKRRIADRLLEKAGARLAGWVLADDGTWARTPDGERIDLGRSRANAAMLATLASAHLQGAGPLGVEALTAAVWPGEQLVLKSARTRVYVALSGLRKAGLEPLIVRTDDGWALDGTQPVFVETQAD